MRFSTSDPQSKQVTGGNVQRLLGDLNLDQPSLLTLSCSSSDQKQISEMAQVLGLQNIPVGNLPDAIEILSHHNPSLVVVDADFEQAEIFERLIQQSSLSKVPVYRAKMNLLSEVQLQIWLKQSQERPDNLSQSPQPLEKEKPFEGQTLLLVDDDLLRLLPLALELEGWGFNVLIARDESEVLTQIEQNTHLEILFLDLQMNKSLEMAIKLRKFSKRHDFPVIGLIDPTDQRNLLQPAFEVDDFLQKPVQREPLQRVFMSWLQGRSHVRI